MTCGCRTVSKVLVNERSMVIGVFVVCFFRYPNQAGRIVFFLAIHFNA